jgi:hypothetical protein
MKILFKQGKPAGFLVKSTSGEYLSIQADSISVDDDGMLICSSAGVELSWFPSYHHLIRTDDRVSIIPNKA